MKNKKKILKYLSDRMNEVEKEKFEKDLQSSESLKREYNETVKRLKNLEALGNVETREEYFSSLLPKIREKSEKQKKRVYTISYGLAIVLSVFVIIFYFAGQGNKSSLTDSDFDKIFDDTTSVTLVSDIIDNEQIDLDDSYFRLNDFDLTAEYFRNLPESDLMLILNSLNEEELTELEKEISVKKL